MLKSHWLIISRLARLGDNLLIGLAFLVTYHFRDWFVAMFAVVTGNEALYGGGLASIETYLVVLGIGLPLYNAFLSMQGAYRSMRFQTHFGLFRIISISSVLTFFSLGSLFFMLKLDLSRSFVGIFCLVSGLSLFAERLAILQALRYFRVRGKNFRNLLIVGTGEQAVQLFHEMKDSPEYGVKIVGFCELDVTSRSLARKSSALTELDYATQECVLPGRLVANVATFERILKRFAVDEVLFTDVVKHYPTIDELSQIAIDEGVRVTLAADLFSMEIYRSDISYFGNIPLIHYEISPGVSDNPGLVIKRLIDIVFSATLLTVLSPVMLITAIAIKLDSSGPIFFKQRRVGLNGRRFTLLKFRSMVPGAARQKAKLERLNEMKGPVFKIANDPRITKVGRFIRSYSIDELPQLINVFRGDMSLVGPRPPLPSEVSHYRRKQRRRLSMRPGLTCIWQVSGRNDIPDFDEWAKLDLEYIDNWNLKRDFVLMLKTIPVVFSGSGS